MDREITSERSDDETSGRYRLVVDGTEAGELTWRTYGPDRRAFTHTVVDPRLRGHGLAADLVEQALSDARSEGFSVVPACSYVADYFDRHPEHADLRSG